MSQTVTNWPDNCDPRDPCFGALLTGNYWPMPWAYAVAFQARIGPGLLLPKCLKVIPVLTTPAPDDITWDTTFPHPDGAVTVSMRINAVSRGEDDFGPFAVNRLRFRLFQSATGEEGTEDRQGTFYRGDVDVSFSSITWSAAPWFDQAVFQCLAHDADVTARVLCNLP